MEQVRLELADKPSTKMVIFTFFKSFRRGYDFVQYIIKATCPLELDSYSQLNFLGEQEVQYMDIQLLLANWGECPAEEVQHSFDPTMGFRVLFRCFSSFALH